MEKASAIASVAAVILLAISGTASAASYTFFLDPARDVVLDIGRNGLSLEKVSFQLPKQDARFSISVYKSDSASGRIYEYFQINASGLQSEPQDIAFDVAVNKSWVAQGNIDMNTIALFIYDGGWSRLTLALMDEDPQYYHFRASPPRLSALFSLVGEPVPVTFTVSSQCNRNYACEPALGETEETCGDCMAAQAATKCVASQRFCTGGYLFVCNDDGSDYRYEDCTFGCIDDACIASSAGPLTGMTTAANPFIIAAFTVLVIVIIYLALMVKGMKNEIGKADRRRQSHEDLKALVKAKD